MATLLTLIRHGETPWNVSGKWQGQAHVPLNDAGRRQAALLAEHLAPNAAEITMIYASDSLRTRSTADILAARLGKSVHLDVRLREIDMGDWQGLTGDEVREWDAERYALIMSDPMNIARPGGESSKQVGVRAVAALNDIAAQHQDEHVLVVTHGGTIVNSLKVLGLWDESNAHIGNTSYTRLLHRPDETAPWTLDAFNLVIHLETVTEATVAKVATTAQETLQSAPEQ
jgi:broad specificity phosphatase PhoE